MPVLLRMLNGGIDPNWSCGDRRRDYFQFQKEQNACTGGDRWTCRKNGHHQERRRDCEHVDLENLPIPNRLERGLFAGRITRRTYALCVLETNYPCENAADASESPQPSPRKHKDCDSKSPRSFYGNKSVAKSRRATPEKGAPAKRICRNNRRAADDTVCGRVFRALGDDLIVEWLTPKEVHYTEIAFDCEYDWGRAWHGGKVKDRAVASRIQFELQRGWKAAFLLEKFNRDLAFSAFWYLLDLKDVIQLAHQYSHYKTIRKLCNFS